VHGEIALHSANARDAPAGAAPTRAIRKQGISPGRLERLSYTQRHFLIWGSEHPEHAGKKERRKVEEESDDDVLLLYTKCDAAYRGHGEIALYKDHAWNASARAAPTRAIREQGVIWKSPGSSWTALVSTTSLFNLGVFHPEHAGKKERRKVKEESDDDDVRLFKECHAAAGLHGEIAL
jgi:hypothetical protein